MGGYFKKCWTHRTDQLLWTHTLWRGCVNKQNWPPLCSPLFSWLWQTVVSIFCQDKLCIRPLDPLILGLLTWIFTILNWQGNGSIAFFQYIIVTLSFGLVTWKLIVQIFGKKNYFWQLNFHTWKYQHYNLFFSSFHGLLGCFCTALHSVTLLYRSSAIETG